jgi:flagellin
MSISISSSAGGFSPLGALRRHQADMASAMERLATGKRINRASDGPADMIAIEHLKVDVTRALEEIELLERENLHLAAREGALSVVDDLVMELRGLTVAAANTGGVSEAERRAMQIEADSILQTIDFLGATSTYNGEKILKGLDASHMGTVQMDDGEGGTTTYSLADLRSGGRLNLIDGDLMMAERAASAAVEGGAVGRGSIGAQMKANESRMRALHAQAEGSEGARSLLEDADVAAEVARLVRSQTMQQAALYATAMSQHNKGTVLKLLGGATGARLV